MASFLNSRFKKNFFFSIWLSGGKKLKAKVLEIKKKSEGISLKSTSENRYDPFQEILKALVCFSKIAVSQ